MSLIDEKQTASILGWLDAGKKYEPKVVKIKAGLDSLELKVKNDTEQATLELILMRNGIKFDITKFSEN